MKRRLFAVLPVVALYLLGVAVAAPPSEAVDPPAVDQPIVATLVAREVSLSGSGFGAPATGLLRFAFDGVTLEISGPSPNVTTWTDSAIALTLPPDVRSGTITVVSEGVASAPIELLVYEYTSQSTKHARTPNSVPLKLAVDDGGTVWINEEFHRELKSLSNDDLPQLEAFPVPQAAAGIYSFGSEGIPTQVTVLGEDIDIAADGSVWFTEGGNALFNGNGPNASRIIRYIPQTNAFECYNIPNDHAEVVGVLLDEVNNLVWYAESGYWDGNAISSFSPSDAVSDCDWDPRTDAPPPICELSPTPGCHRRFTIPTAHRYPAHLTFDDEGRIWFTEFWASRVGRLDPSTGEILEIPMPRKIVTAGPGVFAGSGVWELFFDDAGMLWVSEYFDATVLRVDAQRLDSGDCSELAPDGTSACVEELFVGTNGSDGSTVHSVTPGLENRTWFGYATASGSTVGFIDRGRDDAVVMLPRLSGETALSGIVQDQRTGDIWFAEFLSQRVGRLSIATGDGDGVPAAIDNCPNAYNPGQENLDRDLVPLRAYRPYDDLTWPESDQMGDVCDDDRDNDGRTNEAEEQARDCPSASAATSPDSRDSDGDTVLDGAECLLGTDPARAASVPPKVAIDDPDRDGLSSSVELVIGTSPSDADSDNDGIHDGTEIKHYGSSPTNRDSDGDGCPDAKEIVSVNGDRKVNAVDLQQVALTFGIPGSVRYVPHFDINRDGRISSIDLGLIVSSFGPC